MQFEKPDNWNELLFYQKIKYYIDNVIDKNYSPYTDKIEAKKIVKEKLGDDIEIPKIIRILKKYRDISIKDINKLHIVKSSHGSNWNIDLMITKNISDIKQKLFGWNRIYNYVEKQYRYIKPQFFIEEKINDYQLGITSHALTYSFRCINGNPVCFSIRSNKRQNSYLMDWTPLKQADNMESLDFTIKKPDDGIFNKMIEISKKLSSDFEFVRIDLYLSNDNKIYFSEYTFSPSNGKQIYSDEIELELGKLWQ